MNENEYAELQLTSWSSGRGQKVYLLNANSPLIF